MLIINIGETKRDPFDFICSTLSCCFPLGNMAGPMAFPNGAVYLGVHSKAFARAAKGRKGIGCQGGH